MENELTTQEMFAAMDPKSREEAVRLATRMQEESNEGGDLVAAAYEAGVEDRYLREAARELMNTGVRPRFSVARTRALSLPRATVVGNAFGLESLLLALIHSYLANAAVYSPHLLDIFSGFVLTMIASAVLARRGKWVTPVKVVAVVWALSLLTIFSLIGNTHTGLWGVDGFRVGIYFLLSLMAAGAGSLLGSRTDRITRSRPSSIAESPPTP